ncbi:MAG: LpqB family beta-propeller domain-containing protein [Oryzihumus sp.]
MRSTRARRTAAALLAGVVLVLPTGCVQMPTAGPVVDTRPQGGSVAAEPPIYIDPKPPQPGGRPVDIVSGFLDAMTATPIRTDVAKEFLTRAARSTWAPTRETITYDDTPDIRGQSTVVVTLPGANHLDAHGAWRGPLPAADSVLRLPMVQEDGEWRIARVPDALVVPESWFDQRFRQVSLYFFDPTAQILVPEPVYVPRGEQLATTLTSGVLAGPGPALSRVSRSFLPPGLRVSLSVPVSPQGIADISLDGDAGQQTPQALELMIAQLAWTLRQEPTIQAFRLSLGGQPVTLPGGVSEFRVDEASEDDPTGFRASGLLYGLRHGRLVSGTGSNLTYVDGPLGAADFGASDVAVNLSANEVAAVTGSGTSILLAPVHGRSQDSVHQVVSDASRLLRPAWDFSDRLWLVDDAPGGARVSFVEGERQTPLQVPGVSGHEVRSFLVSRDGSRMVAVVHRPSGDRLLVSRILHDDQGHVLRATRGRPIAWEGGGRLDLRDLAWQSPTTVAALDVLTDQLVQVRTISVDGSAPSLDSLSFTLRGHVVSLAGSPADDQPLYAVFGSSIYDLSRSERGSTSLGAPVSALGYVG